MIKQLILLIVMLGSSSSLFAQALPANPAGGCVIKYEYDAAGNRIKRSKYCWAAGGGGGIQRPGQENSINTSNIEMQIFPNPASNSFSIQINRELDNAMVELQDLAGKLIARTPIEGTTAIFDIQNLSQAAYLVVLKRKDSKEVLVRKLVKE